MNINKKIKLDELGGGLNKRRIIQKVGAVVAHAHTHWHAGTLLLFTRHVRAGGV